VDLITASLLLIGAGFLVANARLAIDLLRFRRRRRSALLTWSPPPPPNYRLSLTLAFVLGVLMVFKVFYLRRQAIGEVMMFLYFGLLVPMTRRIGRGFYADGIWADSDFVPYNDVGGISWREGENTVALLLTSRLRNLARRLTVPTAHYGAARRLLRDKIGDHEIHFSGTGLDLGAHDERDEA
jgi:hypothetical protein